MTGIGFIREIKCSSSLLLSLQTQESSFSLFRTFSLHFFRSRFISRFLCPIQYKVKHESITSASNTNRPENKKPRFELKALLQERCSVNTHQSWTRNGARLSWSLVCVQYARFVLRAEIMKHRWTTKIRKLRLESELGLEREKFCNDWILIKSRHKILSLKSLSN